MNLSVFVFNYLSGRKRKYLHIYYGMKTTKEVAEVASGGKMNCSGESRKETYFSLYIPF